MCNLRPFRALSKWSSVVRVVARRSGISTAEAQRAVDAMIEVASEELARGGDVTLTGFASSALAIELPGWGVTPQRASE
jgi:Bacterial nucleoid DNA-binding protein